MKKISELVTNLLKEEGFQFEQLDGEPVFKTYIQTSKCEFPMLIRVKEESRIVTAHSACPIKVPKPKVVRASEFIARINCHLVMGNFDIDIDDGTIIFRTGMQIGQADPDPKALRRILFWTMLAIDDSFPAIAAIVYSNASPREAFEMLEKEWGAAGEDEGHPEKDFPSNNRFGGWMGFFSNN